MPFYSEFVSKSLKRAGTRSGRTEREPPKVVVDVVEVVVEAIKATAATPTSSTSKQGKQQEQHRNRNRNCK